MTQKNNPTFHADTLPVLGIERLRIGQDGPGVRTLVGLSGCPLECKYCINRRLLLNKQSITQYSPSELYNYLRIDNLYFQATNGGLTFGGGEPLLHVDSIFAFAKLCPQAWSLWVETSLNVPRKSVIKAIDVFDHFIVDIKSTNVQIYKDYTKGDLSTALSNLSFLISALGQDHVTVRIPLIPGYTTQEDQLLSIEYIKSLGISDIDTFVYTIPNPHK